MRRKEASMKNAYCTSGSSPGSLEVQPDFTILVDGSIFLLTPLSESAHDWIEQNIGRDNGFQPWWPTVVIEHRYVVDIMVGIRNDGLVIA
jgi:hypothetical protein